MKYTFKSCTTSKRSRITTIQFIFAELKRSNGQRDESVKPKPKPHPTNRAAHSSHTRRDGSTRSRMRITTVSKISCTFSLATTGGPRRNKNGMHVQTFSNNIDWVACVWRAHTAAGVIQNRMARVSACHAFDPGRIFYEFLNISLDLFSRLARLRFGFLYFVTWI